MERKLSKSAVRLLKYFSDLKSHPFDEVLNSIGDVEKNSLLLRLLVSDGYLSQKDSPSDLFTSNAIEITMEGLVQLEFEEEEISRYEKTVISSAKAEANARTANIISILALIFSIFSFSITVLVKALL